MYSKGLVKINSSSQETIETLLEIVYGYINQGYMPMLFYYLIICLHCRKYNPNIIESIWMYVS